SQSGGRSDARLILRSLVAQLIPRAQLNWQVPDSLPELNKTLEDLFTHLAAHEKQLVVVIDGLDESEDGLSFLMTEGCPNVAYAVVTTRPGEHLDRLIKMMRHRRVPHTVYPLGPLELSEMETMLRSRLPALASAEIERIAEASQGNALYLSSVIEELDKDPTFDLRNLPAGVEDIFERSIGNLRQGSNQLRVTVLGLLSVARKRLSLDELSKLTAAKMRDVDEQAIRPIQQFLFKVDGGYCFYHARFREFVTRKLLYDDELPHFHRLLADWLKQPNNDNLDYRWTALAYHLYEAGDHS